MSRNSAEIVLKSPETLSFGGFSFSLADQQLRAADGTPVPLRNQSAQVLAQLAARPGEIVGKAELIEAVWGDICVTDDSLVQCIKDIRAALRDNAHRVVQTVPRRGYRLDPAAGRGGGGQRTDLPGRGVLAGVMLAVVALVVVAMAAWPRGGSDVAQKPAIAVLAFDDLSTGADKDFLSDAIAEGIITELARFPEFRVIVRNSSFRYRGAATDVRALGADLGVDYVLEGSQQKHGDRLRVSYQLLDATGGDHLLADSLDRDLADLFVMQDEIVRRIAAAVGRKLSREPPPTANLAKVNALLYFMRSRQFHDQFSAAGNAEVLRLNQLAVEADPQSAFGYIGLTYAYGEGYRRGWTDLAPEEAFRRAREAAETAVSLDPQNYAAHMARAWVHMMAGEPEEAVARYRKAIELNPSASVAMASMSIPLMSLGRLEDAVATLQLARGIDPNPPDWYDWNLAWAQYILGDCETALVTYMRMASPSNLTRRTLASIYVCLGQQGKAEATIAEFLKQAPGYRIANVRSYMEREFKDTASLQKWLDDLRIAGLPE